MKLDCFFNICPSVMNKKSAASSKPLCAAIVLCIPQQGKVLRAGPWEVMNQDCILLTICLQLLILTAVAALAQQSELCLSLQSQSLHRLCSRTVWEAAVFL